VNIWCGATMRVKQLTILLSIYISLMGCASSGVRSPDCWTEAVGPTSHWDPALGNVVHKARALIDRDFLACMEARGYHCVPADRDANRFLYKGGHRCVRR